MKTPDSIHCRPGTTDAMQRLADENEHLRSELTAAENLFIKQEKWLQSIVNITKGEPGELDQHSTHDVVESVEALRAERDELAAKIDLLGRSMHEVANKYDGNDSTEWSIGANHVFKLFVKHICSALKKTPAQSLAHIRAAGAREALERAMQSPGFSDTVVRVDALQAVIADMESES